MKKSLMLLGIVLLAFGLLVSCEEAGESGESIDLTGVIKVLTNTDADLWNREGDEYFREGPYTEITVGDWGSAEQSQPFFSNVAEADDETNEDVFLQVGKLYGDGKWTWEIYDESPDTPEGDETADNGFEAGDTVTVSLDLWVPDMAQQLDFANSGQNGWFEVCVLGTKKSVGASEWGTDADDDGTKDSMYLKYEADDSNGFDQGTGGGWETITIEDITVGDSGGGVGVVTVRITMGSVSTSTPWYAYFDNLRVEKQTQ